MQNDVTHDSLLDGKLSIKQARKGYRFSIDAVILASSIQPKPQDTHTHAAGAQCVQLFDSWAGCLSPLDYSEYVLPWETRVYWARLDPRPS